MDIPGSSADVTAGQPAEVSLIAQLRVELASLRAEVAQFCQSSSRYPSRSRSRTSSDPRHVDALRHLRGQDIVIIIVALVQPPGIVSLPARTRRETTTPASSRGLLRWRPPHQPLAAHKGPPHPPSLPC